MKTIINREYAGEKEAFAPLIGFKVVSVEDGPTNGDFGDITVLTLVNEHHVAIDVTISDRIYCRSGERHEERSCRS